MLQLLLSWSHLPAFILLHLCCSICIATLAHHIHREMLACIQHLHRLIMMKQSPSGIHATTFALQPAAEFTLQLLLHSIHAAEFLLWGEGMGLTIWKEVFLGWWVWMWSTYIYKKGVLGNGIRLAAASIRQESWAKIEPIWANDSFLEKVLWKSARNPIIWTYIFHLGQSNR